VGRSAWTIFWPGLAPLWLRGRWYGLFLAIGFAAALNGLLVTTFLWPRLVGSGSEVVVFNVVGWCLVLCFWGASVQRTWRLLPRLQPGADARGDDALYLQAQTEYLRGDWFSSEKHLRRLLEDSPRDADALLLLASLNRRSGRVADARRLLMELERLSGGGKWLFEIHQERRLLAEVESAEAMPASNTKEG
jgi:uncharacterized protein HemY